MAKEIDKIIKSPTPPKDTNVLWDNGENLKIYRNGKWENTNTTEIKENSIPLNALDASIKELLEALKPVQLSDFPPIGEVTQELLDEVGLTEKVINNIMNGYTNKICFHNITHCVTHAIKHNEEESEFAFATFYFDSDGINGVSQYKYVKSSNGTTITFDEM